MWLPWPAGCGVALVTAFFSVLLSGFFSAFFSGFLSLALAFMLACSLAFMFACTFSFAPFVLVAADVLAVFAVFALAAVLAFTLAAPTLPLLADEFVVSPAEQPARSAAAARKSESLKCLFIDILLLIYRNPEPLVPPGPPLFRAGVAAAADGS